MVIILLGFIYLGVSVLVITETSPTKFSARQRLKRGLLWPALVWGALWSLTTDLWRKSAEFLIDCIEDKK